MDLRLLISTEFAIKLGTRWLWLRPRRAECSVATLSWLGKEKVTSKMTIQHSFSVWITRPLTSTSDKLMSFIVDQIMDQHLEEVMIFTFVTIATKITIHMQMASVIPISHLMLINQMNRKCIWQGSNYSQWVNTKCTRSAFDWLLPQLFRLIIRDLIEIVIHYFSESLNIYSIFLIYKIMIKIIFF